MAGQAINFLDQGEGSALVSEFSALAEVEGVDAAVAWARAHARPGRRVQAARMARRAASAIVACADIGWVDGLSEAEETTLYALAELLVRTEAEFLEAESQVYSRVWALRAAGRSDPVAFGHWIEITNRFPDLLEIEPGSWMNGYYSGVLAGLRWAQGGGWCADS
jgi:hypothetical protein